ncbi:MAG: MFS transporter [Sciscionella sp.]
MRIDPYRRVLALPGVRILMLLVLLARIPITATGMVLTLHVVLGLHHGYGAAGLVGAAGTIGIAVGAPLAGRLVDSYGLRPTVAVTTLCEASFWLFGWTLPYTGLLLCAFGAGVLSLPVMSLGRQALAAVVPEEQRRTAFSMDSISVEISYAAGPALGILLATRVSTNLAMMAVGAGLLIMGAALYALNPPIREESASGERPPRSSWLRGPMLGLMLTVFGAIFALAGTEVAVVAALREIGQVGWTGAVTIVMAAASGIGGLIYGGLTREYRPAMLMGVLGLLVIPVGLLGGSWWLLALALIPTNLVCAPTLAATNDGIAKLAPPAARGEAMGLSASATTIGAALGSPLIGTTVDHAGIGWAFAVAGLGGVLVAMLTALLLRRTTLPTTAALRG